jgi:uncharacterized protein
MWHRLWKPSVIVLSWAAFVLAVLYIAYRLVDPLPPRHLAIAAGAAGSGYDNFARQYALILARHGVELEVRNSAGAVENLDLLRDTASGVQAALATFGVTQPRDEDILYSLVGIYDAAIFIFYRNAEPITQFAQFRGKRLSIGMPGTALRSVILQVLKATNALDASTHLSDLDPTEAIDALIAGEIDVAMFPSPLDGILLQRALAAEIRLMNFAQAEAIAKTVPGLKHVVLWRGLISLDRDIPDTDIDLLALRNRLLVRKDLHPALQYFCCLKPCAKFTGHRAPLTVSVNSPPNNPMIWHSLQRHKRFTDRARPSGSGTRLSGLPRSSTDSCSSSFRSSRC